MTTDDRGFPASCITRPGFVTHAKHQWRLVAKFQFRPARHPRPRLIPEGGVFIWSNAMTPFSKDVLAVCRKIKKGWRPTSPLMSMYELAVLSAAKEIVRI